MKRMNLIVLSLLAASAGAFAQDQAAIDKALMAAPCQMKAGATVIKWKADHTYDTLKKGTNKLVCYDRSGMPGQPGILGGVHQHRQPGPGRSESEVRGDGCSETSPLDAAEKDGTRVKPEFGSVWYHLMGADPEHTRTHMTIAVPGATTKTLGLPESGASGGVWIMNAGTTTAHLMTPGE